ncbi:uncharacterized protein LOC142339735 [Convolutriloba macropyga]|uniref:uncharacterized protein LOC142339735 n=1 Tax=Convolutriloba macropyga TaxID=536237 RepID=UPI003F520BB2
MGSRSSPESTPSPVKRKKEEKKQKKNKSKKSKSDRRSRSKSRKETGAFERVLNNYHSTGSSANSLNDEHWLNLALELKPLDEMVGDRDKLMEEVFAILGGDQQLQELLPDVIKKANHSSDEIRELLVSECKRMSDDEILDVLKGKKAVVPANQRNSTSNENSNSNSTKSSKSSSANVEKVTTDDLTKSFLQVDPSTSGEPTPSQMELLELEMRARAIKSLMQQQANPSQSSNATVDEAIKGNDDSENTTGANSPNQQMKEPGNTRSEGKPDPSNEVASGDVNNQNVSDEYKSAVDDNIEKSQVSANDETSQHNNECVIEAISSQSNSTDKNSPILESSRSKERSASKAGASKSNSGRSHKSKQNVPLSDDLLITEISDEEIESL